MAPPTIQVPTSRPRGDARSGDVDDASRTLSQDSRNSADANDRFLYYSNDAMRLRALRLKEPPRRTSCAKKPSTERKTRLSFELHMSAMFPELYSRDGGASHSVTDILGHDDDGSEDDKAGVLRESLNDVTLTDFLFFEE